MIWVSGASGLVGRELLSRLAAEGRTARALVRPGREARPGDVRWDPASGRLDPREPGPEAVVHLAGENVAAGRWTAARRRRIYASRVDSTRALARALAGLPRPPRVLVCASALGYYGDRGDAWLDESSPPGEGFLARLCVDWEDASRPAAEAGVRVVQLRIGVVLGAGGGLLERLVPVFRAGLGGRTGSGRQYVSWVALADVAGAVAHAVDTDALAGPVNAVAPEPVPNAELARALARALGRPALVPLPAAAVRALWGRMGDELMLSGARIRPARLLGSGYRFRFPELDGALEAALRPPLSEPPKP